jgi:hypothetical protein
MTQLTAIQTCSATACSYNNGGCTAAGITVGGTGDTASCATFLTLDARGGLPVADSHVSACQRLECVHNTDLMCTAAAVAITGDTANCASYEVA